MKKISKKISCTLVLLAILVSSFFMGFDSKASGPEFYVNYAEPSTSDNQGYICLLFRNNATGHYHVQTYFWNTFAVYNGKIGSSYAHIILGGNSFEFTVGTSDSATSVFYSLSRYTSDGYLQFVQTSSSQRYTETFSSNSCVGYFYKGNVGNFQRLANFPEWLQLTVNFNQDGSAILLQGILSALMDVRSIDSSILSTVQSILNSVDGLENQLSTLTTYLRGAIGQLDTKLASLLDKADRLIEEQEESNTWLSIIWTSIQRLFKGDNAEDDAQVEEFENETTTQSNKINDLNQQNKTEKVDVDEASSEIDSNIDEQAIANYGTVLSVFTGNTHILQYILIVLAVALIAYVLFGKR